jgi:hypothetical protein
VPTGPARQQHGGPRVHREGRGAEHRIVREGVWLDDPRFYGSGPPGAAKQ